MNNDTIISPDHLPKRVVSLLNRAGIRSIGHLKALIALDPDWLPRIPGFGPSSLLAVKDFLVRVRGRRIEDFAGLPKRLRDALDCLSIESPEELSIFLAEGGAAILLREPFIGRKMLNVAIEFNKYQDFSPISSEQSICNTVLRWQLGAISDMDAMKEIESISRFL